MLRFAAFIDSLLNSVTMYRLVLYSLLILSALAVSFGFANILPYPGQHLLISFVLLTASCQIFNLIFARLFNAAANHESALITGLILFFIMMPASGIAESALMIAAGAVAMASKYILAWNRKHIFNPAAFAAFLFTVSGVGLAFWWIGSPPMFPAVLIAGLLIVRKVRKFSLFFTFVVTSLAAMTVFGIINEREPADIIRVAFLSYPVIFFATVMLTEPSTLPPTKKLQMVYAALTGLIFGSQYHLGPITPSPETALVAGNIFSYSVSLKEKAVLILEAKRQIANGAYEFVFSVKKRFGFIPGQYLEWTLPGVPLDSRGNRRYFTIASSPTEENIKLGVRFYPRASKFKEKLLSLGKGARLTAGQLSGDFTLPADTDKKLVFIAGGIGITPFRSMIRFLLDKKRKASIIFFNINKTADEIPYRELFADAEKNLGIKVIQILTEAKKIPDDIKTGEIGHISPDIIKKYVTDINERIFYISGSNGMVNACKRTLAATGVKSTNVVTDYFPGF